LVIPYENSTNFIKIYKSLQLVKRVFPGNFTKNVRNEFSGIFLPKIFAKKVIPYENEYTFATFYKSLHGAAAGKHLNSRKFTKKRKESFSLRFPYENF